MESAIRAGRYGDERLMQLDVMLIGVNCCVFNGPETPYYPIAIKFLTGALKVKRNTRNTAAAAAAGGASKKAHSSHVFQSPARDNVTHEMNPSSYFDEEPVPQLPAASSGRSRAARSGRREPSPLSGERDGEQELDGGEEDDGEEDEEFVPTKRKSAGKSHKKRARSRRSRDDSEAQERRDDSEAEESDQSWGGGAESSDDNVPAARSTRADRAGARASSGVGSGRKRAATGRSSKRRRLAVSSDSDESEAVSQDDDSD